MFDTLDKIMLAGLGAMSMTKERAEKIFEEYVEHGKAAREEKAGFVKEMLDKAEKTRTELEKIVSEQINKTMKVLNLATKEDIQRVEKKLDKLMAKGR